MYRREDKKGGAVVFVVVLALVLILVGIAFFVVSLYLGGGQETKDAVNAGALNVAKKALDITVPLSGAPSQQFFKDCVDGGNVSLKNINRVWGKALFVGINAEGAKNDGGHAGSGGSSASSAQAAAMEISNSLAAKLNDPNQHYNDFNQYAMANSVRMLGPSAQVEAVNGSPKWMTSCMEHVFESSIQVTDNLPIGYSNPDLVTASKRNPAPSDASGKQFLKGYYRLKAMDSDFWQVAYPVELKPHLVDGQAFLDKSKPPVNEGGGSWAQPVPNSFSVEGKTTKSNSYNESAVSWAETNPQKILPLQFPHGFIRVILKKNTLQWNPNGIPAGSTDYGFAPDSKDSIPYPIGCGSMRGTAYVGYEYLPPTLYKAICALPPINGNALDYILQRVKEMVPGYSMGSLIAKLNLCIVSSDASDQTFFIYPNAGNTDIGASPESTAMLPSGCDSSAKPDGAGGQVLDSEADLPLPNFATEEFDCYGSYTFPTLSLESGTRSWQPGSGWDGGCLGELTIKRTTNVYLFGVCPCP